MFSQITRVYKLVTFLLGEGVTDFKFVEQLVQQLVVELEGLAKDLGHDPAAIVTDLANTSTPLGSEVAAVETTGIDLAKELDTIWLSLNGLLGIAGLPKGGRAK